MIKIVIYLLAFLMRDFKNLNLKFKIRKMRLFVADFA